MTGRNMGPTLVLSLGNTLVTARESDLEKRASYWGQASALMGANISYRGKWRVCWDNWERANFGDCSEGTEVSRDLDSKRTWEQEQCSLSPLGGASVLEWTAGWCSLGRGSIQRSESVKASGTPGLPQTPAL